MTAPHSRQRPAVRSMADWRLLRVIVQECNSANCVWVFIKCKKMEELAQFVQKSLPKYARKRPRDPTLWKSEVARKKR